MFFLNLLKHATTSKKLSAPYLHGRFLTCLILSIASLTCTYSYALEKEANKTKDLKKIQTHISQEKLGLKKANLSQKKLNQQLKTNEKKISLTAQRKKDTSAQKKLTEKKVSHLYKEIEALKNKTKLQKKQLANHIKISYIQSQKPYLSQLLSHQVAHTDRIGIYYRALHQARTKYIKALQETQRELESKNNELSEKLKRLVKLQNKFNALHKKLLQNQDNRKTTLEKLKKTITKHQSEIEYLQVEEANISQIIQQQKESHALKNLKGLYPKKGRLSWPIQGKVVAKYGQKRRGQIYWKGIMVKAKEGVPIKSIAAGKVIFSDWVKGLGMLMIIDHGKGFMTLYGHAQSLLKEVGAYVKPKETIALVGQSGGIETSQLYFEIRYKGKAINPLKYLKKKRK